MEWLIPDGSIEDKIVFYVHGGGWTRGGLGFSRNYPLISPLYGDLKDLPSMLIHAGAREELIDDILAYAAKANANGVEVTCKVWRGMFHDFQLMDKASNISKQANAEIAQFIKQQLGE